MSGPHPIRFYFSFRSPYAWLAAERIEHELAGYQLELEFVPLFPAAGLFPNDPARHPEKLRYVMQDLLRLAKEYQLPLRFGAALDTDWAKAHAAFLGAQELGAGLRFMREMFRARFGEARDVARDDVLTDVALRCELPPERVLEAAHSPSLQSQTSEALSMAKQRDGIFGVPSFVYRGQLFWGHDRLGALRRALDS
jgi:2-hydroxychromene-2-carboxylate isomerase